MIKTLKSALFFVFTIFLLGCMSPIHKAAFDGNIKEANILLQQGVDVNEPGPINRTPLMFTNKPDVVKLLLDRGANVNAQDSNGFTALHFAVYDSNIPVIKILIEYGADVNIIPDKPYHFDNKYECLSPLKLAEKKGNTQIVQMLKSAQSKNNLIAKSEYMLLIAVIDFDAKGVTKNDASRVSEWLRTELINTGQFRVIERSAMNAILNEQALSMTGCTDTSCAVEVGKLLSARKILVGSVEFWNNKVFINGRIIDVEKGVAEFAHKETVNSIKELDTGAASFAKNLAHRINGNKVD